MVGTFLGIALFEKEVSGCLAFQQGSVQIRARDISTNRKRGIELPVSESFLYIYKLLVRGQEFINSM
jgi:hypothetical protein